MAALIPAPVMRTEGVMDRGPADHVAHHKLHFDYCPEEFSVTEKQKWQDLAMNMHYSDVFLLPNAQAWYNLPMSPYGYVASIHRDTPFEGFAFIGSQTLFTHVAYVKVKLEHDNFLASEIAEMTKIINLILRDESPSPPRHEAGSVRMDPHGGWAPWLGNMGWVGIYERQIAHDGEATPEHYLVVKAGLDIKMYDDLDDVLYACSASIPGKDKALMTLSSMFGAGGTLDNFRKCGEMNCLRVLADVAIYLHLELDSATIRQDSTPFVTQDVQNDPLLTEAALTWLPIDQFPSWFCVPVGPPRGSAPPPALFTGTPYPLGAVLPKDDPRVHHLPSYVEGATCVSICDVLPLPIDGGKIMGVYMGATCTRRGPVVCTNGPTGPIRIYNEDQSMVWDNPALLHAVPATGTYTPDRPNTTFRNITWERADLKVCRPVAAEYKYNEPKRKMAEIYGKPFAEAPAMILKPLFVRSAAKDAWDTGLPSQSQGRMGTIPTCNYKAL